MRHYQTFVQIRHNCAVLYDLPATGSRPAGRNQENFKGQATYSGKTTQHGRKRILAAVDVLLQKSPNRRIFNPVKGGEHDFRIGFWTLTLADEKFHTATETYKLCLKPFLRAMRGWGCEDYIWKAELTKRGQLHYHLTTNQFVHYEQLRAEWNKLQKRAGWLDSFARRHKHFNPNSTDVHAVWKVRNLAGYMAKYLAKVESEKEATEGKVWDCSKTLKIPRYTTELTSEMEDRITEACDLGFAEAIRLDNCTIIRTDNPAGILDDERRKDLAKTFPTWQIHEPNQPLTSCTNSYKAFTSKQCSTGPQQKSGQKTLPSGSPRPAGK